MRGIDPRIGVWYSRTNQVQRVMRRAGLANLHDRSIDVAIAMVALVLGAYTGVVRMRSSRETRETGTPDSCERHLRNVVLGVLEYAYRENGFPSGTWPNPAAPREAIELVCSHSPVPRQSENCGMHSTRASPGMAYE